MHFHKYPHPFNFEFVSKFARDGKFQTARGRYRMSVQPKGSDLFHLQVQGPGWEKNDSQSGLRTEALGELEQPTRITIEKDGSFSLRDADGGLLLRSKPGRLFGQSGEASMFEFVRKKGDQFYGMGEKWTGFEHSGKTTKFWNTDVWGDFDPASYIDGKPAPDPVYVSVPYLILKRGNSYLGFLMDNPHATFISTGFSATIADQMAVTPGADEFAEAVLEEEREFAGYFHLGAESGQPNLHILVGPTLPELTRKLQSLVGTTPLPPAWALGYHQCRWGYESEADLLELDAQFLKHEIPVDGLWLDIDYMEGYRVFTFCDRHFANPKKAMAKLAKKGRQVVPIIDPGVKYEAGYGVYERGAQADAFCRNKQGLEYVGLVWPGQTVFPDFSLARSREWWSKEVTAFAGLGLHGAWLDMNDPSTGPVENEDMLFDRGRKAHRTYHNQYALGMAEATREGFLKAHPKQRPFLLSRSGFIGSNRYTAIWTGDNYSNYHHLKNSIATTLNLALSGIPFNGPDVGGFGGDTTPQLIQDWFKACFLFPFMRNHSLKDTRKQEPWAFGKKTLGILRNYIRLRYRLRPYLYQLFAEHERSGEAILRPLFYDFSDSPELPLGLIDDQFMVGPHIMQAPFLEENQSRREIVLPQSRWYDLTKGVWREGHQTISVTATPEGTPVFVRDHSIVPLARLDPALHKFTGGEVDFHIFLSGNGRAESRYFFDDGNSFEYQRGKYSELEVAAERNGHDLYVEASLVKKGMGSGKFTFTTTSEIRRVLIDGTTAKRVRKQGVPWGEGRSITWEA